MINGPPLLYLDTRRNDNLARLTAEQLGDVRLVHLDGVARNALRRLFMRQERPEIDPEEYWITFHDAIEARQPIPIVTAIEDIGRLPITDRLREVTLFFDSPRNWSLFQTRVAASLARENGVVFTRYQPVFDASADERRRELVENARIHIRMEPRAIAPPTYRAFDFYVARHYLGSRQADQLPLLDAFEVSFIETSDFVAAAAAAVADPAFQREADRARLLREARRTEAAAAGTRIRDEDEDEDEVEVRGPR